MQIYLVGGAIRDALLGLPIQERDWVIVGACPKTLIDLGFQPVGKDFPVFLHPITHEEYALARTERKIGKGYKGFTFYSASDVTLEEDLKRRDLTINAMAQTETGELIDPYGGYQDLQNRVLRHVSPAFQEDPVRILRVARFAAKLPDFDLHPATNQLMLKMVKAGEVDALVAERVWQELNRALEEPQPLRFFSVLIDCHALSILFPPLMAPSAPLSIGFSALKHATELSPLGLIRFAAFLFILPTNAIQELCQRYRVPTDYRDLTLLVSRWFPAYQQILTASPESILQLIKSVDALRRPERFEYFLTACDACLRATQPAESGPTRSQRLQKAWQAVKSVNTLPLQQQGLKGQAFAEALQLLQLTAIQSFL